jgi:asparagine synthase (glutamine-hydrolysing)
MRYWIVVDLRLGCIMGVLYGCWIFDDKTGALARAKLPVSPVENRDSKTTIVACDGPCVLARGLETTGFPERSAGTEEHAKAFCAVWDGRLDNRHDLAHELGSDRSLHAADVEYVLAAFSKWGTGAFQRLRGDWTVTIWNAQERTLTLAKDSLGTRPLYYSLTARGTFWSNSLEWLVRQREASLKLNVEYLAGWLSFFAAPELTPYSEIHSVPPSSFVQLGPKTHTIRKYWEFSPARLLRYPSDTEYEEHFRAVFAKSIRRRLRSEKPLLAELSGGMDSSSIVCVADAVLAREQDLTPRLDTLSYYDDKEPNWDERPYFSQVEAKRGREGIHFQLDAAQNPTPLFDRRDFAASPAELGMGTSQETLMSSLRSQGYGAILSGIGGDEFTGGVPTPIPEVADLVAGGQFRSLAGRLKAWSLSQRRPWMHVLWDTIRLFVPFVHTAGPARRPPSWLEPRFRKDFHSVLRGYEQPLRLWGPRPSFQENLSTVNVLRRQLGASHGNPEKNFEKRYPYLDVDFLQFLFSVPREQLVQPGRRRFLMRRALVGIVPDEILNRKRKAYVVRAPRMAIAARWGDLQTLSHNMIAESLGIVSSAPFRLALENVRDGKELAIFPVRRMLQLECWLRNITGAGVVRSLSAADETATSEVPTLAQKISAS